MDRGGIADASDVFEHTMSVEKTSETSATLSLSKRRLFFCKGNLTISANIVRYLQGKTKVNYI
jgi:hypothetical protein